MVLPASIVSHADHSNMVNNGYQARSIVSTPYRSAICYEVTYVKAKPLYNKIGNVVLGCLGLPFCCCCCNGFVESTFLAALEDEYTDKKYFENPEADQAALRRDTEILGFNPRNRESLKAYLLTEKPEMTLSNGHLFKIFIRPSGISGYILVPNRDIEKVHFRASWNARTGEPTRSELEVYKDAVKFASTYRDIEKAKELKAQELARKHGHSPELYKKRMDAGTTKLGKDGVHALPPHGLNSHPKGIALPINEMTSLLAGV